MKATLPQTASARPVVRHAHPWQANGTAPKLYRFHDFKVVDVAGNPVGVVDWIWADGTTGSGTFIGTRLQWLRGKAQAIPAQGAEVDMLTSTVRLTYHMDQIKSAPRFAIDYTLTADQERAAYAHYSAQPALVSSIARRRAIAA